MVEMPMMSTRPGTEPGVPADAAALADAPQGAFEEMLARRLGRELVGRYAGEQGRDDESEPSPWMPPAVRRTEAPGSRELAPTSPAGIARHDGVEATPVPAAATEPSVSIESPTVKVQVNRPGFRVQPAEAGNIQPGPVGDVWTQPSGFADLHLTRSTVARIGAAPPPGQALPEIVDAQPATTSSEPIRTSIPEPPVVHWSPAPARAALAAAAGRDLELEIVNQLAARTTGNAPIRPDLELVTADHAEQPVPQAVSFETSAPADAAGAPRPAVPAAHSSLIDRITTALEIQRHLPPPRAVSIEIPEMDGVRLLVTMRMDGTVHVASTATSTQQTDQVTPLLEAVNDALTERGFDMSADTGGRQDAAPDEDDQASRPPRPFRLRRPARRAGLRI